MIKACIIDDEINSREVLELMLTENHPDVQICGSASNINTGLELVQMYKPDVIFLDIEMPGGNGFELVKQLTERIPEIIFCTAYGHYAIKAIECSALAYLMKPVSSVKLAVALEKARIKTSSLQKVLQLNILDEQLSNKMPTRLLVNTTEDIKVVKFADILCCIAESNYTRICLADGSKIIASKTLKEFENMLHQSNFFRIHHSYLINMNYIMRINKTDGVVVELPHNINLDVARAKRDDLLQKLTQL
ncbi:MAG: LytTR family DNA-binding domain-containing protein [Ferruginibacter sp.]